MSNSVLGCPLGGAGEPQKGWTGEESRVRWYGCAAHAALAGGGWGTWRLQEGWTLVLSLLVLPVVFLFLETVSCPGWA